MVCLTKPRWGEVIYRNWSNKSFAFKKSSNQLLISRSTTVKFRMTNHCHFPRTTSRTPIQIIRHGGNALGHVASQTRSAAVGQSDSSCRGSDVMTSRQYVPPNCHRAGVWENVICQEKVRLAGLSRGPQPKVVVVQQNGSFIITMMCDVLLCEHTHTQIA